MKKYLPLSLLIFCSFINADNFTGLYNLTGGTWQMKTVKGYTCEHWTKASDDELKSTGFKVTGNDTTVLEHVLLVRNTDGVFYKPVVNGQNAGEVVSFKLQSAKDGEYIFTDPSTISHSGLFITL